MPVLDISCGAGQFLRDLHYKGVTQITGVDHVAALENVIHSDVRPYFIVANVFQFLGALSPDKRFDVLGQFGRIIGRNLLLQLTQILKFYGLKIFRIPNMASPWVPQHYFSDLTHKEAYTSKSIRQLKLGSGLRYLDYYPQRQDSNTRKYLEGLLHSLRSKILVKPPEVWCANVHAILGRSSN